MLKRATSRRKRPTVLIGLILFGTAFSQQASRTKADQGKTLFCGLGGAHECHCLVRTQLLQNELQAACDRKFDHFDSKQKKLWLECMGAAPVHCDVVLNSAQYAH